MALTPDRQGYLGRLETKTLLELQELLERQEKLLSNTNLVKTLPDKGEKVVKFAEKLRQIIKKIKLESKASEPISDRIQEKSIITRVPQYGITDCNIDDEHENQTVNSLLSRNEDSCILVQQEDEPKAKSGTNPGVNVGELSSNLQELKIGNESQNTIKITSNSYERVIKKAADKRTESKPKYLPHRSLKYPVDSSPSLNHGKTDKKKTQHTEESAVNPPPYSHESTKLISIEESVILIQEQRERNINLVAQRAAQRLADQLGHKMETYLPANPDMQYRETTKGDDLGEAYDSDDVPSDVENDGLDID